MKKIFVLILFLSLTLSFYLTKVFAAPIHSCKLTVSRALLTVDNYDPNDGWGTLNFRCRLSCDWHGVKDCGYRVQTLIQEQLSDGTWASYNGVECDDGIIKCNQFKDFDVSGGRRYFHNDRLYRWSVGVYDSNKCGNCLNPIMECDPEYFNYIEF